MLEAASDLSFDEESVSAGGIVGVVVEDLLESYLAIELGIERDEDGAQAPSGMGSDDAEPQSVGGGRAHGNRAGAVGVIIIAGRRMRRAHVPECRLSVWSAGPTEAFASRASHRQDCETLLDVAAEGLNMHIGDCLDSGTARGIQVSERDKMVGQRSALVASPGGEGRKQRPLVDHAGLEAPASRRGDCDRYRRGP